MSGPEVMHVVKRSGAREEVSFDKIMRRIKGLANGVECGRRIGEPLACDYAAVAQRVIMEVHDGIKTSELDECAADVAISLDTKHPDYGLLAARILVANLHKNTLHSFTDTMKLLYRHTDEQGRPAPLISSALYKLLHTHGPAIEAVIDSSRDYRLSYFGLSTAVKSYLIKYTSGSVTVMERPCHFWMRVSLGLWGNDLEKAFETYQMMSTGKFIHATPTLLNCGTPVGQLSSCFLLGIEDSIGGIYECLTKTALISKLAGGIGIHVSNIRAQGSLIRGSNGRSSGLVPMLKVFNDTARYVNQGGHRKGAFAIYLEPWHADIFEFLDLKKNHGKEELRARDLFYALWIPDLFMRRLEQALNSRGVPGTAAVKWSLMCPDRCPGLADCYGEEFEKLYERYESEGKANKSVNILEVWDAIIASQQETGGPYMLYKDSVNAKSNQKNVGIIRSSNLCTEIMEYSDHGESAVCNLASLVLCAYVVEGAGEIGGGVVDGRYCSAMTSNGRYYDFAALGAAVRICVRNLNRIIDINAYPTPCTRRSNLRHRPIGIGVQGLADTFCLLRMPFDSPEAAALNRDIFETIYYHAVDESRKLALVDGSYETFAGSPASEGQLQPDLWGVDLSKSRWDWAELRAAVVRDGLRNSLLVAPMPTASTAQILGNNECFEPFTHNLYIRRVAAGEFKIFNRHLQKDLVERGLYNKTVIDKLVEHQGSVQAIEEIPEDLKRLYKTSYEIPAKVLIDLAAQRGPFIDQSQSLNIFMAAPEHERLTKAHLYSWKCGLKTGMYYLRGDSVAQAQQFTVAVKRPTGANSRIVNTPSVAVQSGGDKGSGGNNDNGEVIGPVCRRDDPNCFACSS